jgi:protein-S-isoprenylcysteine O-methyltransferase Ste14
MDRWHGTALFLTALATSFLIRAPHDRHSKSITVLQNRRGKLEIVLIGLMGVAVVVLPALYTLTSVLAFADYPLTHSAFVVGFALVFVWLVLLYKAHADLGPNWSITLQLREHHQLVTTGVYAKVRHPMYTALFAHAFAQAALIANWIAGPAMLVAFTLMFALRLRPEERMMRERFGAEYEAYVQRTKRLLPGIW